MQKTVKKITCMILCMAMMLSMLSVNIFAATYPDKEYWATEALNAAVKNEILYGRENGDLDPEANLTRAEMAAIIVRAFGADIKADISQFTDVSPDKWYYNDIAKAVHMEVFVGSGNGKMNPDANITREEVFTVIARALVLSDDDYSSLKRFNDKNKISSWAKEYISVLARKNYVNGDTLGNVNPTSNITRAEFAQLMHNIFKTYFKNAGTYTSTGADSTMIKGESVNLSDIVVEGDLVIGDGADLSTIVLTNVDIKGRLLVRGSAEIRLVGTTVGENVVVKNKNSIVHFDNYRTETVFDDINMLTEATFKKKVVVNVGDGGGDVITTRTVTFDSDGGSDVPPQKVKHAKKVTRPSDPVKNGYEFLYWSKDGVTEYNFDTPVTADITLKAIWRIISGNFIVTFDTDGGTPAIPEQIIAAGEKATKPSSPSKEHYVFKYWALNGAEYDFDTPVTGNITLVAEWEVEKYQITFDSDGGSFVASQNVAYNGKVTKPSNPTKTGYTFKEWTLNGVKYNFNIAVTGPFTLKATWTANTYRITFDTNGGNTVTPSYVYATYDDEYPILPTPTHSNSGLNFAGWFDEYGNQIVAGNKVDITENTTVKAKWTNKDTFIVTFKNFSGEGKDRTETVIDGDRIIRPQDPELTGYTFGGWFKDSACTVPFDFSQAITAPVTIYVKWDIQSFTVAFNSDGGSTVVSQTVNYNSKATEPAKPSKTGYTFKYWMLNGAEYDFDTPVTKSITLTAKWEINKYIVTFDSDGGSLVSEQTVEYNNKVIKPNDPKKDGHTFKYWTLNGAQYDFNTPVTGNITLVAKWEINKYTVIFDSDGGTDVENQYVEYMSKVTNPSTPSKTGYTFKYWTLNGAKYDFDTPVTGNITLVAEWEVEKYQITFDSDGGSFVASQNVAYNGKVTKPSNPSKTGYTFKEWTLNGATYNFNKAVTGPFTLKAAWTANTYRITFDANGGNTVTPSYVDATYDSVYPELPTPSNSDSGVKFAGWFDANGNQIVAGNKVDITENITVKAKWTNKIIHNVIYKNYSGEGYDNTATVIDGEKIVPPQDPKLDGCAFGGWYADSTFTEEFDFNQVITGTTSKTIIIYAKWDIIKYTVEFNSDGGSSVATQNIFHGDKATEPTKPTKEGYTFKFWMLNGAEYNFDSAVIGNITLTAKWEINKYTVTFDSDGGSLVSEQIIEYNNKVAKPVNPTKTGYTFKCWMLGGVEYNFDLPVTNNLELKALWEIEKYNVTFDSDGGSIVPMQTIEYQGKVLKPADPSKTGYIFKGWKLNGADYDFSTPVTGTITLKAEWEIEKYEVLFDSDGGSAVASQIVEYNSKVVEPKKPTKTGYTFKEWTLNGAPYNFDTAATGSITLKATWTANTYKVTFDVNGGNAVTPVYINATYNSVYPTLPEPTHSNSKLKFAGWFDANGNQIVAGNTVDITSDITVIAKWTEKAIHNVVLKDYSGSGKDKIETVVDGEKYTKPKDPTLTGYTFDGWYKDETYTVPFDFDTVITAPVTIYVKWNINKLQVTFDSDGGSLVAGQEIPYNGKVTKPSAPSKTGYTFKYWELNGAEYDFDTPVTENITLKAVWEIDTVIFNVKFVVDGIITEKDIPEDELISDYINAPSKTGYEFTGWNTKEDGSGTSYSQDSRITASVTLYAQFKINEFSVEFDSMGGSAVTPQTVKYMETATEPTPEPTKDGFIFAGWYTDYECTAGNSFDFTTPVTENIILYAKWIEEAQKFNVNFFAYNDDSPYETIVIEAADTVDEKTLADTKAIMYDSEFDSWAGYEKNATVSDVYAGEDYQHQVEYNWWYKTSGGWKIFDDTVKIVEDTDVYLRAKKIAINLYAGNIPESFPFEVWYEDDTRLADSVKNIMYTQYPKGFGPSSFDHLWIISSALDKVPYFDDAKEKLVNFGVIDEDKEILNQEFFIRFSQIIGEENMEDFIVDAAKDMFDENDKLKDAMLRYFKSTAQSSNPQDVADLKALLKETIDHALEEDRDNALLMIEKLARKMLEDEETFKTATGFELSMLQGKTLEEFIKELIVSELEDEYSSFKVNGGKTDYIDFAIKNIPYNKLSDGTYVYSNAADLYTKSVKQFIVGLVKANLSYQFVREELGYTDAELFSMAREKAIDVVLDRIISDEDFLDMVIEKEFKGTPLADYDHTKIATLDDTVELIADVVKHELESVTDPVTGVTDYDKFAVKLGYASKDAMLADKKQQIKNAIIAELEKEEFFNELILHTAFNDFDYDYLKSKKPVDIFKEMAEDEIKAMTDAELAAKLKEVTGDNSITSVDAMISYIKAKIKENIINRLEDDTDELFDSVYKSLVGEDYSISLSTRQVVAKIVAKAEEDQNLETTILNNAAAYENAVKELTDDKVTVNEADDMSAKDFVVLLTEINLDKDDEFKKIYEEHKGVSYQNAAELNKALVEDAKKYAIDEAKKALEDEKNLKKEIKELTGFDFDNISGYTNTFDLIVDYVKKEFEQRTFEEIVSDFHYQNIDELLDDAKPYIINDVIDETKTNATFRRAEIERFINASITDDSKKITFGPLASGDSDGDNLPDKSLDFISLYSKKVIATLSDAELMAEMSNLGYTVEKIFNDYGKDAIIEMFENPQNADEEALMDEVISKVSVKYDKYNDIPDNVKTDAIQFIIDEISKRINDDEMFEKALEIAEGSLGIGTIDRTKLDGSAKEYIIETVINLFKTDKDKQDEIIAIAIDAVVENSESDMLEELIDSVIDYLNSDTEKRDGFIDEIIENIYRDTLDRLVKEINNDKQFSVDKDSIFIAEGLKITIEKDYSYEEMIKKLPYRDLLFKIYPESKVQEIYNRAFDKLTAQIDQAIIDAENGKKGYIDCGITIMLNPIVDVYIPLYSNLVNEIADRAGDKYFYSENLYLQQIIKELSADKLFDGSEAEADEVYSGYSLKSFDDYYNMVLKFKILIDDTILWYRENLVTEAKVEALLTNYEELALKYANLVAEFIDGEEDGDPGLQHSYAIAVKKAVETRFPEYYDNLLNWYQDSPANKKYESTDYALFRKEVRALYDDYDMVTDAIFDYRHFDKMFDIADKILVEEGAAYTFNIENELTGLKEYCDDADIYEVSVKGQKGTLVRSKDIYEIIVKDFIITIKRAVIGG